MLQTHWEYASKVIPVELVMIMLILWSPIKTLKFWSVFCEYSSHSMFLLTPVQQVELHNWTATVLGEN